MSAYHQLGHHSESMVLEQSLQAFSGVILSPVNYSPAETPGQCERFRHERPHFDVVFDPQLYVPQTGRGKLQEWTHMPTDLDTHDPSSVRWWAGVVDRVIDATQPFRPSAVCSPAPFPRAFDDGFYEMLVDTGNLLSARLRDTRVRPVLTALVGLADLGRNQRHLQVASLLSRFVAEDIYLLLADDEPPRFERADSAALEGAIRLIRLLTEAGFRVTVGCTSSEMILWKAAGAAHVATGKFFNLRRFTLSRWDDEAETGGRNISYWFEPSLLAFLREADLRRYMRDFPISELHEANPHSRRILEVLQDSTYTAWLAESWRQFLFWFAECERQLAENAGLTGALLQNATANWQRVHAVKLRMEEPRNDGAWVRAWDIALSEADRRPD